MKKASTKKAASRAREIEPFDSRTIDFGKFKPDLPDNQWQELIKTSVRDLRGPFFPLTIDRLSPARTVGSGRTNVTIIMPTIVQTDATVPVASFNRTATPTRNPIIQIHFEPSAYGITNVANYVITFSIQVFGQGTFNLSGFAGSGTVANGGTKVLSNQAAVTLLFGNVPPSQQTFAFLEQTAGQPWSWFSTRISFPLIISF